MVDVESIVTAHTRDDLRQHHPDCELDHPTCAILKLAAEVARLQAKLQASSRTGPCSCVVPAPVRMWGLTWCGRCGGDVADV